MKSEREVSKQENIRPVIPVWRMWIRWSHQHFGPFDYFVLAGVLVNLVVISLIIGFWIFGD